MGSGIRPRKFGWPGVAMIGVAALALLCARRAQAGEAENWPGAAWEKSTPAQAGLDSALLEQAARYAQSGEGSGCIIRHGRLVYAWGDQKQRYDLKSTSKSIGVTALGLALADGKMRLTDKAAAHHPALGIPPEENQATGWIDQITIFHLATQTAGFDKPGGYTKLLFQPGTQWSYSDGGPNWLAECITLAYQRDVAELLFERVFTPIGIAPSDLVWRNNSYRQRLINGIPRREFGSGVSANVDAMARIGLLYLRQGRWKDKQILPAQFVAAAGKTPKELAGLSVRPGDPHPNASHHYGLLFWNNNDGTLKDIPTDTYWSWGLYDSLTVVMPSLDIVIARAGKSWKPAPGGEYEKLTPFFGPIVKAASPSH